MASVISNTNSTSWGEIVCDGQESRPATFQDLFRFYRWGWRREYMEVLHWSDPSNADFLGYLSPVAGGNGERHSAGRSFDPVLLGALESGLCIGAARFLISEVSRMQGGASAGSAYADGRLLWLRYCSLVGIRVSVPTGHGDFFPHDTLAVADPEEYPLPRDCREIITRRAIDACYQC